MWPRHGQGNRLKLSSSDEACQILVVPSGGFASQADGILPGRLAVEVVGDVSACREIGRGVGGSDATFVVAEDHVHDPVQRVFNGPVRADHRTDSLGLERERGDIKARFVTYLARDFALALHHDDALEAGPFMSLLQPCDIMQDGVFAGFDAAMISVHRFVRADRCVPVLQRFLLSTPTPWAALL